VVGTTMSKRVWDNGVLYVADIAGGKEAEGV